VIGAWFLWQAAPAARSLVSDHDNTYVVAYSAAGQ
jgi:hypothetical protein